MIEVWVEGFSFRDLHSIWRLVVIAGHNVINIVDVSGSESDLEEISGPYSAIGIFSLILRVVRSIDVIVNVSVSFVPFLVVILFKVLMSWVNGEVFSDPSS